MRVAVVNQPFYRQWGFGRYFLGSTWEGGLGPYGWRWQDQGCGKIKGSDRSMWGGQLKKVEDLQREQKGRDSRLGTTESGVDQ